MGVRENVETFRFYTPLPGMFGVKKYDTELRKIVIAKGIEPYYQHELVKVEDDKRLAWFKNLQTGELCADSYDLMNACPPQKPNEVTAAAPFADANGFVDVDQYTLQSKKYDNIFCVGDSNNAPNAKTAAAVYAATPTVIHNINCVLQGVRTLPSFDGYGSCPIFVGDGKLLLAEFTYGGVPRETFSKFPFVDQSKAYRLFYYLKRHFFPYVYWNVAPKGNWYGTDTFFKPTLKAVQ